MKYTRYSVFLVVVLILNSLIAALAVVEVSRLIQHRMAVEVQPGLDLSVSPSFYDWGTYSNKGEAKNNTLTIENTGMETLYVYWETDLEDTSAGPYFTLTTHFNGSLWQPYIKVSIPPGQTIQVELTLTMVETPPQSASYTFIMWIRGDIQA